MRNFISKYKWVFAWSFFGLILLVMAFVSYKFWQQPWFGNLIQTFGIITVVYASIVIFLQTREDSKKGTQIQIGHLQKLNDEKITAMAQLFQNQIDSLSENTNRQIKEFQKLTELQIQTIQESTSEQIEAFEIQTNQMIIELSENSFLLGEILARQLEDAILDTNSKIGIAKANFKELQKWKLGRTPATREKQLKSQELRINSLAKMKNYFQDKYDKILQFLGKNNKNG